MSEISKNFSKPFSFTIAKAIDLNLPQLNEIIEIERNCRLSRWSVEDYRAESERQYSIFLIAEADGILEEGMKKIIGFMLLRINQPETSNQITTENYPDADLLNFGVINRFQNLGIGKALFDAAYFMLGKSSVSTVWLEVRESNLTAIKFYERRNFMTVQKRKNFYRQPLENALLMKLNINPIDSSNVG